MSAPPRDTEVLVVGAGPAGLATAIRLAMHGIAVTVVDALAEAQNTSRAAVIHAATLEALDALGVADALVACGIRAEGFRVRDRDAVLMHADFTGLPGRYPFALMIPQDETEQLLLERLRALGGEVLRPVRYVGHARHGAGVEVACDGGDRRFAVRARWLVGADGGESRVRADAGIAFPGDTYGSFLLADATLSWPLPRDEVSLFFSRAGTMVVAPMSRARFRIVAQLEDAPPVPGAADVQRVLDARGPRAGVRVGEVLWGSRFRVHHKLAARFRDGAVLLVGDAAHVHSPAGGQGMNLGLRDAVALGDAIATAHARRDASPLDDWAAERRQAARAVLRMTDRLTRVATVSNPLLRLPRNALIALAARVPAVRRAIAETLAGYR